MMIASAPLPSAATPGAPALGASYHTAALPAATSLRAVLRTTHAFVDRTAVRVA